MRWRAERRRRWRRWAWGAAGALLALAGCSTRPAAIPAETVSSVAERGPLRLTVAARPAQARVGDTIIVRLLMTTPEDHAVTFPAAEAWGALPVTLGAPADPRPGAASGLEWSQEVGIDPTAAGVLEIPPLAVRYTRRAADGSGVLTEGELVSDTLKVEVRSVLTTQDSVAAPRDVTGTRVPPWRMSASTWALLLGGAAVLATAVLILVWLIRRQLMRPAPPVPADVWALRALSALADAGWLERYGYKEYYYRLTEIVRAYVERQFGLAAPEMTTEEFLNELSRARGSVPYDASKLRGFLEACDIVKYAAFAPTSEDADGALATARSFVRSTAAAATAAARAAEPATGGRAA
ncbi:MAG: hypothetical protein CHACPFDD_02917 [Phycisphaerae bacterium]|nr:hypothetical protein [Phycisphaerae bacterium]